MTGIVVEQMHPLPMVRKDDGEKVRVVHGPDTHPEEWEGGVYMGSDGYTMHLDAGGFFDAYQQETTH